MYGRWLNGAEEIKEEVRGHFSCQFKEEQGDRPALDGVQFKRISEMKAELITAQFLMERKQF